MTMLRRYRSLFISGFLTFMVCIAAYTWYVYQNTYSNILNQIDVKLNDAAVGVKYILGEQYHNQITDRNHLSADDYLAHSKALSEFAKQLELEYVYAMVLEDEQVLFTASSYQTEDWKNNKITYFFDPYPEATEANKTAFFGQQAVYEESIDQWGHFRSILKPFTAPDGRVYLAGADIRITDMEEKLTASIREAAITACFFFIMAVAVAFFYIATLRRNLTTDSSSGFPNHVALEETLRDHKRMHLKLALLTINDLEEISNFYGVKVAERAANTLMRRIEQNKDSTAQLFRVTHNKVALLSVSEPADQSDNKTSEDESGIIEQLLLDKPVLQDPFVFLTITVGVATGNKTQLLENAYIASTIAMENREKLVTYSDALHQVKQKYQHNVKMAREVYQAFEYDRVVPFYQPIVDLQSNKVVKYECLARIWQEPDSILVPDDFLSVVYRGRMDGQLCRIMCSKAAEHFKDKDVGWSINLSPRDMLDPSLSEFLIDLLEKYPDPSRVCFELLESEAINNFAEVSAFIERFQQLGVKILIDDFGVGYANVSHLFKLSVNGLKIDGSLIQRLETDRDARLFIEHIVKFAEQVNMDVIAEHVDTKRVSEIVTQLGVRYAQGFYFGRPTSMNVL